MNRLELAIARLHEDHGMTAAQLSKVFGIPTDKMSRLLHRALVKYDRATERLMEVIFGVE